MKKISYLILLPLVLGCQREREITPRAVQLIEGTWEAIAWNPPSNGNEEWKEIDHDKRSWRLIFRSDGIPVDADGLGMCCPPNSLLINGNLFFIKPKLPLPSNGSKCAGLWCRFCETIEIQVTDDNLLWTDCIGVSIRYRRLP